jgi:hypothetical protein
MKVNGDLMAVRKQTITLGELSIGHMIEHDGAIKVVDGLNAGYPRIGQPWSLRITFTDATTLYIEWPNSKATVEVVTAFY